MTRAAGGMLDASLASLQCELLLLQGTPLHFEPQRHRRIFASDEEPLHRAGDHFQLLGVTGWQIRAQDPRIVVPEIHRLAVRVMHHDEAAEVSARAPEVQRGDREYSPVLAPAL